MSRGRGRVLVLTGRLCGPRIREAIAGSVADVLEIPIQVAALMTQEDVRDALRKTDLSDYGLVLVPGKFMGALMRLEREFGLPFYRGPVHDLDIPLVLSNLDRFQLSQTVAADELFQEALERRVEQAYNSAVEIPTRPGDLRLGSGAHCISVGPGRPPRLIAEVIDAPRKHFRSIIQEATRYVTSGADIIDVGMIPGQDDTEFLSMIVPALKRALRRPISVDTMRREEIIAAANAGCDLILSICGETLDLVSSLGVPVVVVPMESVDSDRPKSAADKLKLLADFEQELGEELMILDPLLEPIGLGFTESIQAYWKLGSDEPSRHTLMGVGNVVEMADVDSVGVNALLAAVAVETGADLMLTTENSPKTKGSVSELSTACRMMHYAHVQRVPPKDLGVDLLRYKEKVYREYPAVLPARKVRASSQGSTQRAEKLGNGFHIVTRGSNIHVISYVHGKQVDIIGKDASEIADELQRMDMLSDPRHAVYLGSELQKAESAIRTGRSYVQDEPLFRAWGESDDQSQD